jgi:large subunit ribosomal protein L3
MIRYAFTKVGMTSSFDDNGSVQGVTVLKMVPAQVVRHEKLDDGKILVVVKYGSSKNKNEFERGWVVSDASEFEVGTSLKSPSFATGQKLKITGVSKGLGFQDVVTLYNFAGGPASHGSRFHRAPGSIGMRTEPGRVRKGTKMPRRGGNQQITLRNIHVAYWSTDESVMAVVGGIPGARGGIVFI